MKLCAIKMLCLFLLAFAQPALCIEQERPLPSWKDGGTRVSILRFVKDVTDRESRFFVPAEKRIATFDNDGTLWCEKPIYPQFVFAIDRLKEKVLENPELKKDELVEAALSGDFKKLAGSGSKGIQHLIKVGHGDLELSQYEKNVGQWIEKTEHPRFKRTYTRCVYKPMLELLSYLQENGFANYIVSGGGREFMRVFADRVYGIPPERVIGSSSKLECIEKDDCPIILRKTEIDFLNDGPNKPVGIQAHIGMRPVAAFGNSDGDLEMLKWTMAGEGKRFALIVHHTDDEREYAYDKDSSVGRLDKALEEARKREWTVVDMKNDWREIFPEKPEE